jgi:hypothetical protein
MKTEEKIKGKSLEQRVRDVIEFTTYGHGHFGDWGKSNIPYLGLIAVTFGTVGRWPRKKTVVVAKIEAFENSETGIIFVYGREHFMHMRLLAGAIEAQTQATFTVVLEEEEPHIV